MVSVTSGDRFGSRVAVGDAIRAFSQFVKNVVSESWHQRCEGRCSAVPAVSTVKMCVYLVDCEGLPVSIPYRAGNTSDLIISDLKIGRSVCA